MVRYWVHWEGSAIGQSNMGPFSKKSNAIEHALISIRAKTSYGQKWMKHGKDSWINDDGDTMEIQSD